MCGIAGHIVPKGARPDRDAVDAATRRMAHRGPDDGRVVQFDSACLGHRRLSIIDVAESHQPWSSEDGRYTIVFNGEIYNYLELRAELESGFHFRTHGDTEVLLALYIRDGERCLEKLNGMFAFAIWDNHAARLFMARDRVGKKPLFYALFDGGIAFSSEIEPLLCFKKIDTAIDSAAVHDFFAYQFIPAPRTIYRAIRKLPAAHFLTFDAGNILIKRYWSPPFPVDEPRTENALRGEIQSLLHDAVRLRLRSDVPIGAFLSGGIDSSIVVDAMTRLGVNVESFHVGFDEASFDETAHARLAAEHFRTRHHSQKLPLDFNAVLDTALRHFGEPFADPSAIPTWHLCRHTRQFVTVALSGDGADELFAGYRRYFARRFVNFYLRLPKAIRSAVVTQILGRLPEHGDYYAASMTKQLRLFVNLAERTAAAPNDLLAQTFSPAERRALLAQHLSVDNANHVSEFGLDKLDDVSRMMFADIFSYLPEDILAKVDRMSMAHALEVRSPFLDYRIVEFACRLPLPWKMKGRTQKRLLRSAFGERLPSALRNRPKHGFAVPLGTWFRTTLSHSFRESVLDATASEYVNREAIVKLWDEHQNGRADHGFKLWSLLVFHRWYQARSAP